MAVETTWFVVGPLAFAGENDGLAAESEFAGWAAEMFSGNHAVEKTGDMSELALPMSRMCSVAPLWVVFQHCQ